MTEWAAVSAVAALAGFGLAFATFWLTFGGRISAAETNATNAIEHCKELDNKLAVQIAAFALYREQVARDYVHREMLREFEDRLTQAIDRLSERLDRFTEAALHRTP